MGHGLYVSHFYQTLVIALLHVDMKCNSTYKNNANTDTQLRIYNKGKSLRKIWKSHASLEIDCWAEISHEFCQPHITLKLGLPQNRNILLFSLLEICHSLLGKYIAVSSSQKHLHFPVGS